jgi:hypothetical protein
MDVNVKKVKHTTYDVTIKGITEGEVESFMELLEDVRKDTNWILCNDLIIEALHDSFPIRMEMTKRGKA